MNKKKLLALLVSSAFLFAACGDDDSPSSPKNNSEISSSSEEDDCGSSDECGEDGISSSSKKGDNKSSSSKADDEKKSSNSNGDSKSSSSVKSESKSSSSTNKVESSASKDNPKSSSSIKDEPKSSSSVAPDGARAAKLEDLEKNYELKLFDHTVYLSTGSKQGLISLRIPNELWVITYTDFANGEVKFVENDVGMQYSDTDAAKAIMGKLGDGFKLSFIVDKDGLVKYAVDGSKDYSEAVKASVALQSGKVSKAEDIKDKVYECADGDTTRTFTFFDNSYIVENTVGAKVAYWIGGHYDIQRSTLLLRPFYYNSISHIYSMYGYSVGTDNSITLSEGSPLNCTVRAIDYEHVKASDFVGEWQASQKGVDWEFSIKADGSFELIAFENNKNVEAKQGFWDIYGNHLMLRNKACLNREKCSTSAHGAASVTSSSLEFKHSDPDTPQIPTTFEATQYE